MRHGHDSKLIVEAGKEIGFGLGADFVAEHEFGIAGIRRAFGMGEDAKGIGLARHVVTRVPKELFEAVPAKGELLLGYNRYYGAMEEGELLRRVRMEELRFDRDLPLGCAWDENSFCIRAGGKLVEPLRRLGAAIRALDAAIFYGERVFFANAPLVICVASEVPASTREEMEATDRERLAIQAEADRSGVVERLRAAGKEWYSLRPARHQGVLRFWLNPMQQEENNYGWFTVEQLDQWAKGEGPIPKRKP